jgi:hypothetical protein
MMESIKPPRFNKYWPVQKNDPAENEPIGWLRRMGGLLLVVIILFKLGTLARLAGTEQETLPGGTRPIHIHFQDCPVNCLPGNWQARDHRCAAKIYSVQQESECRFIHADSRRTQDQIGYEVRWPLREFPVLQWRWRAVHFPTGSDERENGRNDSVLGLYVIFGQVPFIKTIKYVWSDRLPVGACFPSPHSSTTRIMVVRSGRSQQGAWVTESRDVLADYIQIYGEGDKNPVALGIGLLTDSDDTRSRAVGDYAEFKTLPPDTMQLAGP